jgi:hypothetical protein
MKIRNITDKKPSMWYLVMSIKEMRSLRESKQFRRTRYFKVRSGTKTFRILRSYCWSCTRTTKRFGCITYWRRKQTECKPLGRTDHGRSKCRETIPTLNIYEETTSSTYRRPRFDPRQSHEGFIVKKWHWDEFSQSISVSSPILFPPTSPHSLIILSWNLYGLEKDSVVWQST